MIFNISTRPLHTAFAPLFWIFDETIPKGEKPTPENFRKCFLEKCRKNEKPGPLEKMLLATFAGGGGILGGGLLYAFGRFKDSKLWKIFGGIISLGGMVSVVTGLIQYSRLEFDKLFNLTPRNNGGPVPSGQPDPVSPPVQSPPSDSENSSEAIPRNRSLVIIGEGSISEAHQDRNMNNENIPEDERTLPGDIKEPTMFESARRVGKGTVKKAVSVASDTLQDPLVSGLVLIFGGAKIFLVVEALKAFQAFQRGEFKFEDVDPKTGKKTEYSYKNTSPQKLFEEACKKLGVGKNATPDEVKKAYRNAAFKHHPDRNPGDKDAEHKFKEAAAAYEIICKHRGW